MAKLNTEVLEVAKSLGYSTEAIHRNDLADAKAFMRKIAKRCPENIRHDVDYAAQVIINTLAWSVAERVLKDNKEKTL